MSFFKNKTVIGLLCVVPSLVVCFAITPMFNRTINEKAEIVRVTKNTRIGGEITKDMMGLVEVGTYNLPEPVVCSIDEAVGKYALADMAPGDYTICSKAAEEPATENAYLYSLNGEKRAISVSVKTFANRLSRKLIGGDIVSMITPDYGEQGSTVISLGLQYVEVTAVTANSGYDVSIGERGDEETGKELPGTMTLPVIPGQGKVLAKLEANGKLHLSLVYRGTKENARKFVEAQRIILEELCPPEGEEMGGNTEGGSKTTGTEIVGKVSEGTIQGREPESTAGSESGME